MTNPENKISDMASELAKASVAFTSLGRAWSEHARAVLETAQCFEQSKSYFGHSEDTLPNTEE